MKCEEVEVATIIRLVPLTVCKNINRNKATLLAINECNKMQLKEIIFDKNEIRTLGKIESIKVSFMIYNPTLQCFYFDPSTIYSVLDSYILTALNISNEFYLYSNNGKILSVLNFHEVIYLPNYR